LKEFIAFARARPNDVLYSGAGHGVLPHLALVIPHVKSGRLRALGITSGVRAPVLPEVPTIIEAGVPGYEAVQWSGFLAPAGIPKEILARLHKEIVAILRLPEVQERLASEIATIATSTPEQFSAYLKSEIAKWTRAVQAAGIQPE
jgi:tripartite-type tricarboxylate transporter receptor subunit TctC